jgi:hypothetical protein
VDGEVHGVVAVLKVVETGPKVGRSGPSTWRRSGVKKEVAPSMTKRWQAAQQSWRMRGEKGKLGRTSPLSPRA